MLGLALWSALAVAVAPVAPPTGPDDTCPSARQVADALQAHLPAQVVAAGTPSRPDLLRAQLEVPADGTVIRFSLIDAQGVVQLRRALPSPGRGLPVADCVALAETLAVIVERYFSSVPFETEETEPPPPPPPAVGPPSAPEAPRPVPPPGPALFVGTALRPSETPAVFELGLGATVGLTKGRVRLAALLRLGIAQSQASALTTTSLRRFAGRVGLFLAIPAGPGTFEPTLELGADTYLASKITPKSETSSLRATPIGEAKVGYRVALGGSFYLRPHGGGGFAIVPYDVVVADGPTTPKSVIFKTPAWFSTIGLDVGLVFR